jgi:tetratricopeptide (TPR) repeat protein
MPNELLRGKLPNGQTMRSNKIIFWGACCALLISLVMGMGHPLSATPEMAPGVAMSETDVDRMLSIAEAQHEIIKLLIAQGHFDRVLPEMRKILELKLPEKYEPAVAQSASLIANLLVESKQFALAHELLDEAIKRMTQNENKASLLKIQAYVYKTEGNLDKALDALQQAIELEKQKTR